MGVLFNDVVINKLSGGLGRRTPNQDMVSGLLFNSSYDPKNEIEEDKLYRLASIKDAKDLGIDASYDKKGVSAYYQISQFFRVNPSGDLFIMRVNLSAKKGAENELYAAVVEKSEQMIEDANGVIRQLAVVCDKFKDFDSTTTAIKKAKTITEKAFKDFRPVEIILEGKGFDVDNLIDLKEESAENVSVTIAMDRELANSKDRLLIKGTDIFYDFKEGEQPSDDGSTVVTIEEDGTQKPVLDENGNPITLEEDTTYKETAAVGVLLGAVSKAKVSENIAWVEKFNLTGEDFRSPGFVGGKKIMEGTLKTLDEYKYIFTRRHIGLPGVYFNDSHTCTVATSDFTYIEANRTINKAARIARTALLPKLNSPVLVDSDSGKLAPSVVKGFETLCRAALERMISNEEVSELDVYVDPNQDILANSELEIEMSIVPMGTARRIIVNLGFKNPFQLTN